MNVRHLHTIRAEGENGRNSEGAFLRAPDGSILFAYSAFREAAGYDGSPCDIAMIRSRDEGQTWSEPEIIAPHSFFGTENVMSVSAMPKKDGTLCFYFLIKEQDGTTTIGRSSSPDGAVFTPSRCDCRFQSGYYVINNDRLIRLKDGRIAAPAGRHDVRPTVDGRSVFGGDATDCIFLSDDDGDTFTQTAARVTMTGRRNQGAGMQEPGILELDGGVIRMWARTNLGYQYECFSFDGMQSFTMPEPSEFTSPCSPMGVWRDADGTLYAVHNPIPNYNGRVLQGTDRTPLVLRKSVNGGVSFGPCNAIEEDPTECYCYPSMFFTNDGGLLIAYLVWGKHKEDGSRMADIRIVRVEKSEVK